MKLDKRLRNHDDMSPTPGHTANSPCSQSETEKYTQPFARWSGLDSADLITFGAVVYSSPVVVAAEVALTLVVVVVGFLAIVYVADVTFGC